MKQLPDLLDYNEENFFIINLIEQVKSIVNANAKNLVILKLFF